MILFLIGEIFIMAQNVVYLGQCSLCFWKIDILFYCVECHINVIYQSCLTVLLKSYILNDFLFVPPASEKVLKSTTIFLLWDFFHMYFEIFWSIFVGAYIFRTVMSFWCIDNIIIIYCSSLSLIIFLILKPTLCDTKRHFHIV